MSHNLKASTKIQNAVSYGKKENYQWGSENFLSLLNNRQEKSDITHVFDNGMINILFVGVRYIVVVTNISKVFMKILL